MDGNIPSLQKYLDYRQNDEESIEIHKKYTVFFLLNRIFFFLGRIIYWGFCVSLQYLLLISLVFFATLR